MVRPISIVSGRYIPGLVPNDPKEYERYLREEFDKISAVLGLLSDGFDEQTFVAPVKPRIGMRKLADGTSWNPGSGAGLYEYYGTAWHFLG